MYLVMRGEVTNNSGKSYHAVVFRAIIFIKNIAIGNITFIINGFNNGQTREFEAQIGELQFDKVIRDISRHEIYAESAY